MSEISAYIQSLRTAMAGSDPALIQDALSETEALYRRERVRLSWAEPMLSDAEGAQRALAILGPPLDRAEACRQRERVVAEALDPTRLEPGEDPAPPRPWPSFFGVFRDPKAYTSLLYLFVSLVTGIFYSVWVMVGLSLSLGLCFILVGIPLLLLFLGSVRALGLGEGRLVEALLDVRMPRRPPLLPEGERWGERLRGLFSDPYTWKCMVYLAILLPLGILYFTAAVVGLCVSLSLVAGPVAQLIWHMPFIVAFDQEYLLPTWLLVLLPLGGILGLTGTLHLALGLGRLHGSLARGLLVRR